MASVLCKSLLNNNDDNNDDDNGGGGGGGNDDDDKARRSIGRIGCLGVPSIFFCLWQ
jgi:hypothetical protein